MVPGRDLPAAIHNSNSTSFDPKNTHKLEFDQFLGQIMGDNRIYAYVDYEDLYVQPLLLSALKSRLPPELLVLIKSQSEIPTPPTKFLQWLQYESIDFDHVMQHATTSLANCYIIRKALIRKHYLSSTVNHWITKRPDSLLAKHVKPSVEFEVDYAEFLDDALVEAWELKESWERNANLSENEEKEWWILKPGMSDRGQGIRLFSSEEELAAIFEEWDPPESEDDESEDDQVNGRRNGESEQSSNSNGIMTSHLRHFVAQPYIHPPLLLSHPHPSANRKFHIRTYILATGALKVHVYKRMLALFAAMDYRPPKLEDPLEVHLTNTCLQTGERKGSVHAFWDLPDDLPIASSKTDGTAAKWKDDVFNQICALTGEIFEAAARTMSVHFQPLPNAFEVFALDFFVDADGTVWLLEVNAFPDFKQTGPELKKVIEGLFEGVVDVAVRPFFGLEKVENQDMIEVLNVDLGRR